jgi:hypothetical protein
VDLFLIIGGYISILFVSKAFIEFKDSKLWKLPVLYLFMIFKRYMRMMPVYFFTMMFFKSITPLMIDSPYNIIPICHGDLIWRGLNLFAWATVDISGACTSWCWYLIIDFQLFLFVPGIIMVHMINKKAGIGLTSGLIAASFTWSMHQCYTNKIKFGTGDGWKEMYYVDFKSRACVYLLGCLLSQISLKPVNLLRKQTPIENQTSQGNQENQETQPRGSENHGKKSNAFINS